MKIVLILLFSISLHAQDEEGTGKRRSLFEVIRKDRSLFKKVSQLPSSTEEGPLSHLRTSIFLGKKFGRQDLTNSNQTTESFYNDDGTALSLGLDYYLTPWLSFSYFFHLIKEDRQRYDGFQVPNSDENLFNHELKVGVDYSNLFLQFFYSKSKRYWPIQNEINQLTTIDQGVFGVTAGSRIFLNDPIAIDLFYSYGVSQSLKSETSVSFEDSSFFRIGGRIYWAGSMHFGVELYEETSKAKISGQDIREKNFAILPYWRF